MATGDVTIAQDGAQGHVRVHPYLVTLVRWCVSCLWSTATVFLHRLVTTPLPQITASKHPPKPIAKPRQAGTDHLHPEPRVECVVLHTPDKPTLDVIFVHGLYGSLGNTWRQGEWRSKYKMNPKKVPLRNHTTECKCTKQDGSNNIQETYTYETNFNETNINETVSLKQINGCFKRILPNENSLITEKFYNNTFINDANNYESQAKFVTELFKNDCDKTCDLNNVKRNDVTCDDEAKCDGKMKCKCDEMKCKNETELYRCEIGCGCVCDDCYSTCWPRDWIKEDFPGARVISINYTSDPYLWRPLWVKGNKRLRLHERAEQMMEQLISLGVGHRPIVWVGHSKGGLFIKQIYCEAYEAYLKTNKHDNNDTVNSKISQSDKENKSIDYNVNIFNNNSNTAEDEVERVEQNKLIKLLNIYENMNVDNENMNGIEYIDNNNYENGNDDTNTGNKDRNYNLIEKLEQMNISAKINEVLDNKRTLLDEDSEFIYLSGINIYENNEINTLREVNAVNLEQSSNKEEDMEVWSGRARVWRRSLGFMFYSVPHRGSPLADIYTPITARSVELLEISKDCDLVLELQSRWLAASSRSPPVVRSLVETCRTLMSVLWLRIVSVDSADAGIGSLHGVSVDHREICKPSSRKCLLYTELTELITKALNKCDCQ